MWFALTLLGLFAVYRMKSCLSSSSDSGDDDSQPSPIHYYQDDPHLPVFSRVVSGYCAEQVARILLNPHVGEWKVCHVQPMGVVRNPTFIDLDDVNFGDLKADDLGVWKASGTKTTFIRLLPSGSIYIDPSSRIPRKGPATMCSLIAIMSTIHTTCFTGSSLMWEVSVYYPHSQVWTLSSFVPRHLLNENPVNERRRFCLETKISNLNNSSLNGCESGMENLGLKLG